MLIRFLMVMAFALGRVVTSHAADFCGDPDSGDPRVRLALKSTQVRDGVYIGEFEIENIGLAEPILIAGEASRGIFAVEYPDVSIEFKDLNARWTALQMVPGTFIQQKGRMEIARDSKARFTTTLMTQEVANLSASEFRILVRAIQPKVCMVSRPFHAVPSRQQVVGFEASEN